MILIDPAQDERGYAEDVFLGDDGWVGRCGFKFERVESDWDWTEQTVVEFLVERGVAWGGDVDEAPFDVFVSVPSKGRVFDWFQFSEKKYTERKS